MIGIIEIDEEDISDDRHIILELPIEPERNGIQTVMRVKTNIKLQPEIIRCKECRWGRDACGGNIECFVDANVPEYHGYDWFCPNGERRTDE